LRPTDFQVDDKFFQEKCGLSMRSCLSPIVSNIFMEHSEKMALDSAQHKPSLWPRYLDDELVLVVWDDTGHQSPQETTHTGRYLNFNCNHPSHGKRGLIQSLHNIASSVCQERQDLVNEISSRRSDLQLNGYSQGFIDSANNSKGSSLLHNEQQPLGSVYIPYAKDVSEKFKRIENRYNIMTQDLVNEITAGEVICS
ncbi:hypothetical protein B7P43_G14161, partial [Cryptotermes secundus]